jgi:hypothetical protein
MRTFQIIAVAFCLSAANAALASPILVTLNTSSIVGTTGSLDFQFNPGPLITQAATVQITNFIGGTLVGIPQTIGDVTGGPLPAAFTINNTNLVNDYFQSFTYGNSLSFLLNFSGPAVTSPNGQSTSTSEFTFSTFSDQGGITPVLTPDPNGISATVVVNLNGSLSASAVSPQAQVQTIPEPGSLWLFSGALAALGSLKFLRRRTVR